MKVRSVVIAQCIVAMIIATTATQVSAVDATATPTPSPSTVRGEIKQNRQEMKGLEQQNRTDAAKKRGDRLQAHCTAISTRITNVDSRIDSRITKQKSEGKDTSTAEAASALAKTDLASANSLCAQAVAKFNSVPTAQWSTQQPVVLEARSLAKQAHDAFVSARKDVMNAIHALQKNVSKTSASPTPVSSPTL